MSTGSRFFAALLALSAMAGARAEQMQIQFAEKIQISAVAGRSEFDAYGRRFTLELSSNERVLAKLPVQRKAALASLHLWRGSLVGQSGSWARLAEFDGRIEGVIWDGHDLYAVTRYDKIAANLTVPIMAAPGDTVVFRLSDTTNFLPRGFCALEKSADGLAPNNGLVQYRKLVASLGVRAQAATIALTDQVEISLIADSALATRVADPSAEMLAGFNIVDGIYAEQVGLLVLPTDVRVTAAVGEPFTTTDASGLLAALSTFRQNTPAVLSVGIAHLVTGKDLDGEIIGIARLSGVCSARDGVSLSEGWHGTLETGLIMAHELGHNLGAEHDAEAGSACAATPSGYLMDQYFNTSATFSQCSLDSMRPVISAASCITPAVYGDVELPAPVATPNVENDTPIVLPFAVRSVGTAAAQAARLVVTAPNNFSIAATSMPASCTLAGNTASCDLGDIPAGETRTVNVTLLPAAMGYFIVDAHVTASNNRYTTNDQQSQPLQIIPNADARVTMTSTATSIFAGDAVDYTIAVTSLRSHASHNTTVNFDRQQYPLLHVESANVTGGGSCTTIGDQVQCALGDVTPGSTRTIQVHARGYSVGSDRMLTRVYSDVDGDSNNDFALVDIEVKAVHDVGVEDVTQPGQFQLGKPFEIKANLHSTGIQSVDDVHVQISLAADPAVQNAISSVTIGGTACVKAQPGLYQCTVGTLAAGEVRAISVKANAAALGYITFWAQSSAATQDDSRNDFLDRTFNVVYGLDAEVSFGSATGGLEGAELWGEVRIASNGLMPSTNAVTVLELPAEVRFTRFAADHSSTSCTITDPQHLRCTYAAVPSSPWESVVFYVTSDVPGNYEVNAKLTLAGDENPANDSAQSSITVGSIVDVSVSQITMGQFLYVGHDQTVPFTVRTGARPATNVQVSVSASPAGQLAALTTDTGSCTRINAQAFSCALGDLPGNAAVNMSAVVSADSVPAYPYGQLSIQADTDRDNNRDNNRQSWSYQAAVLPDVSVTVGTASAAGTAGIPFPLPTISLRHTGSLTDGILQVTLPAGVSVSSLSGTLTICSGTTVLQCLLPSYWDENQVLTLNVMLNADTASTFNVLVHASGTNDQDATNGDASIAVTVKAPAAPPVSNPQPPSSGGGGGGGGGRFEWLALAVLGLLVVRRVRRQRHPQWIASALATDFN